MYRDWKIQFLIPAKILRNEYSVDAFWAWVYSQELSRKLSTKEV